MGAKKAATGGLSRTLSSTSSSLLESFKSLVNNPELADVCFLVGDERRKIFAHRAILASRCEVFRAMFSEQRSLKAGEMSVPLYIPDMRPPTFLIVLDFLYTGSFSLSGKTCVDVLATSCEYGLEELRQLTLQYIFETVDVDNVCSLLQAAKTYKQEELGTYCFEFIEQRTKEVFCSKGFVEISEGTLSSILKSDNLTCNEAAVLKAVKEWGTVNSVVTGDPLSVTVAKVIEFVRFPLLDESQLQHVEKDNEANGYIPERLIMAAWKYHALKQRDLGKSVQTTPRYGSGVRPPSS